MAYAVDFKTVSTVGPESSPFSDALAGLESRLKFAPQRSKPEQGRTECNSRSIGYIQ